MTVKYGKFELPTNIKIEEASKTDTFARIVAEAFERGFGHTVGNALRRIMLTALEALGRRERALACAEAAVSLASGLADAEAVGAFTARRDALK